MLLDKINSPEDLKKLHIDELDTLATEIRQKIISTTLSNGGHMASSLGAVEIILAVHYVFDAPEDKIIFDVGHQGYAHKLITGRKEQFDTIRQKDGLSGFIDHQESEYDTFDSGHASSSISLALGLARARDIKGENYNVVTVIGDGSISGGMALEAINDAGNNNSTPMVIVLNDNEMSISKNVGGLSAHLSKLRTAKGYIKSKKRVKSALSKINRSGKLTSAVAHIHNTLRYFLIGETVFTEMGIKYLGPINGHSVKQLVEVLRKAKEENGAVVVHAVTCKGCGYEKAEINPEKYHGVSPKKTGNLEKVKFAQQLGDTLERLADVDDSICTVTAGMPYNTGLKDFAKKHPNKFFDTGIAEQHALAMAGGLSKGGMKPIVVIYSTFLQRGFDQLFHDICLQNLPVTICVDHAGLVGEDGKTHQGIYDMGFLRTMPNLTVLCARDAAELDRMLEFSINAGTPVAIRYPKGEKENIETKNPFKSLDWDVIKESEKGYLITFGACVDEGIEIANSTGLGIIDARVIKPLDKNVLNSIKDKPIYVLEDNSMFGGLTEAILGYYAQNGIRATVRGFGLEDKFVSVGSVEQQRKDNKIDIDSIVEIIKDEIR